MHRRDLLKGGAAAAVAATSAATTGATIGAPVFAAQSAPQESGDPPAGTPAKEHGRFHLKYAPHFGMFKHHAGSDPLAQLQFMRDEGFVALEDNGMAGRAADVQESIAKEMDRLGIEMGVFVAHGEFGRPSFNLPPAEIREKIEADMRRAVEVAKRVNAKWATVVPGGIDLRTPMDYQMGYAIDNLRFAAEILEPAGLTIVLEALNPWRDHPGLFLSTIPQGYALCRGVDSPSVKILDDLYHQQITEGNLIPNIDRAWDEIGYFQMGDNPGRKEPGTGEINYNRVFAHIHRKGFSGIMGMEHGNSMGGKEGERAVIDAYVAADAF